MTEQIAQQAQEISLNGDSKPSLKRRPFGKEMLKEFTFDPEWRNLNNGVAKSSLTYTIVVFY